MSNFRYAADIVFVIDVTGSMRNLLDNVKSSALSFYDDLKKEMGESGRALEQLRVRVVAFRDFAFDSEPLAESPFFTLPDQADEYREYVEQLKPTGGGDDEESALEALWVAMNSDWESGFDKARHIVVVFTDTGAHPLGASDRVPPEMPKSMDELSDFWFGGMQGEGMDEMARRLLIFAPAVPPWDELSGEGAKQWDKTLHFESAAGSGLDDVTYDTILHQISNSAK